MTMHYAGAISSAIDPVGWPFLLILARICQQCSTRAHHVLSCKLLSFLYNWFTGDYPTALLLIAILCSLLAYSIWQIGKSSPQDRIHSSYIEFGAKQKILNWNPSVARNSIYKYESREKFECIPRTRSYQKNSVKILRKTHEKNGMNADQSEEWNRKLP